MSLIRAQAVEAITTMLLRDIRGPVAVDANLYLYKWYSVGLSRGIIGATGEYINHIQGAFFQASGLIAAGLRPTYIFDGPPPIEKAAVLAGRRERRGRMRIPAHAREQIVAVFRALNLDCGVAAGEAEAAAAAWGTVVTADLDALVFGADRVIISIVADRATMVDAAAVLRGLGLTRPQFVDMCIAAGCDYTAGGMGAARALRWIRAGGQLDRPDQLRARHIFTIRPPIASWLCWVDPAAVVKAQKLRAMLLRYGLSAARIDKRIEQLNLVG